MNIILYTNQDIFTNKLKSWVSSLRLCSLSGRNVKVGHQTLVRSNHTNVRSTMCLIVISSQYIASSPGHTLLPRFMAWYTLSAHAFNYWVFVNYRIFTVHCIRIPTCTFVFCKGVGSQQSKNARLDVENSFTPVLTCVIFSVFA